MHVLSVSEIKRGKRHFSQDKPKDGSRLRVVYDRLQNGEAVCFADYYKATSYSAAKQSLELWYGMDLRRVGVSTYVLCG